MEYTTKSAVISRKPGKEGHIMSVMIAMYPINDGHKSGESPEQILEYEDVEKVEINGLTVEFFTAGNDIVLNNLDKINVEIEDKVVKISK
ncbi:hypothetical protein ACFL0W_04545 [Nanoarchaeota archaeon]